MPMTNGIPFMDHTGAMRYPADMNFGNNTGTATAAAAVGGLGGWKPQQPNPYLEGVEFPTQNSGGHKNNKRMPPNQRSQFYRLNKSSSLHDIAMHEHEHPNSNGRMPSMHPESVGPSGGISWGDEPWNTTQSTMNQPTMNVHEMLDQQRHFGRASSTKSLHQTNEELWANNMWSPAATAAPGMPMSMNPMMFATGQMPMPNTMHRSMHELHNLNGHRAPSPTTSQKSKKSRDRFQHRANKARQRNQSQQQTSHVVAPSTTPSTQEKQPASRPHSRNHSKQRLQKEKTSHRGYRESSRTRQKRRSMSSEDVDSEEVNQKSSRSDDLDYVDDDDDDDEASMKNKKKSERHRNKYDSSEDDDFFTGESDNDFVSLSSGSNSKRAPRKSWECQHCTYVNNPGVSVCAMCCRTTSKQPRSYGGPGDENERASSRTSMKNKKKPGHRSKYDSSEDDESEAAANRRHQKSSGGTGSSRTNSLKRGGGGAGNGNGKQNGRKKHGKSPIPDVQALHVSDPDDDGINEYYAVRHMDSRQRQQQLDESSSETSSMHNNSLRKPNLDAPAPARGILKKSNSNQELTKIEQQEHATGIKSSTNNGPPGRVIDIKKYLAKGPPSSGGGGKNSKNEDFTNDIWQQEKSEWMRQNGLPPPTQPPATGNRTNNEVDYLSDDAASNTSTANNIGRPSGPAMTRSISGHSLGDLEFMQHQYDLQQQQQQQQKNSSNDRRTSADVSGKKNFRSKRFSRNIEREPAMRRAQSLHMDRSRGLVDDGFMDARGHQGKKNSSGSSGPEDTMHFTATVQSSQQVSFYFRFLFLRKSGKSQ